MAIIIYIFFRPQLILFAALLGLSVTASGEPLRISIAEFSSGQTDQSLPDHWQPLIFKKIPEHTRYQLVQDGSMTVVRADSQAAASGLVRRVTINLKEHPILHWRWKINNPVQKSDARRKDGDDYPARIYIMFSYEPDRVGTFKKLKYKLGRKLFGDIPIAAINYIWEPRLPVDTMIDNPYTSFAKMIVVQSGAKNVGQWISEQRNVYQDYIQAFGEEPPPVNGVAIMTDTDNTGEQVTAFYGDIYFTNSPVDETVSEAAGGR